MKRLAAALAALTLLRLIVAAFVPLAPDEAYYWVWSRALAPGYLDHPPMVALWIRAGTLLAGDTPLGIRLLGPLSVALASILLADAGELLLPGRRAGLLAASLLNATLLFGAGAVIMTPDTPLLFFWTCCLCAAARWLRGGNTAWWLAVGLAAGLALSSKYTAALLWFGIGLWLLATPALRRFLLRPAPWLGALLGLAVFSPVLAWNASHGWASFAKQGGRVAAWDPARAMGFLGELAAAQAGLATPLVFLLCMAGILVAVHRAWRTREPGWTLLAALTLPPILLFVQHALGDRVQGNWPAIVYPAAGIAAAGADGWFWQRLRGPAVALGLAVTALVYVQATLAPLDLPPRFDPTALRLAGWDTLAAQVELARRQQGADFVAADQYGVAAELARELPGATQVVGIEPRWSLFDLPAVSLSGRVGILVRSARRSGDVDRTPWSDASEIGQAERGRNGVAAETFRLFRIVGRDSTAQAALLPRP